MWKKNDEERPQSTGQPSPPPRPAAEPRRSSSGNRAVLGESIRVEGEITGSEDLLIEGEVEGRVDLRDQSVTIGRNGRVKADVHGNTLIVEGRVQGNLFASEQVAVRSSGEVRGNITSPRVTLEDGAKFKGSIDMEPSKGSGAAKAKSEPPKGDDKSQSEDDKPSAAGSTGGTGSAPTASGSGPGAAASGQQSLAAKGSSGA